MRTRRLLVLAALLVGCGGAPAASPPSAPASASGGEVPVAEEGESDEARRIRELEERLAQQSAEVRDLREELAARSRLDDARARREVVRIGEGRGREPLAAAGAETIIEIEVEPSLEPDIGPEPPSERDDATDVEESASRPVLRLHGPAPRPALATGALPLPGSAAPAVVPPPPPAALATLGRLPAMTTPDVPAIPEVPVVVAPSYEPAAVPLPSREPVAASAPQDDPIARRYQAALAHVEARRWDEALSGFRAFADAHPSHPYADNALFWQGEIHFVRREYRRAIETLEALLVRYPHGNKVPDALLRIGLSYERLGERDRARGYFRRVREEFPDSVAARQASREET